MTKGEVEEALVFLNVTLDGLDACVVGSVGMPAYDARRAIGDVRAYDENYLRAGTLGAPLLKCFTTIRQAGATFVQFEAIRRALVDHVPAPAGLPAVAVAIGALRMTLAQMVQLLAVTTFRSREEANAAMAQMARVSDPVIQEAADDHDSGAYQALLAMHAAVVRDLSARSLVLPRLVSMTFGGSLPSLWLSQRIYSDGARSVEIRDENRIVHPLFCRRTMKVLSA